MGDWVALDSSNISRRSRKRAMANTHVSVFNNPNLFRRVPCPCYPFAVAYGSSISSVAIQRDRSLDKRMPLFVALASAVQDIVGSVPRHRNSFRNLGLILIAKKRMDVPFLKKNRWRRLAALGICLIAVCSAGFFYGHKKRASIL